MWRKPCRPLKHPPVFHPLVVQSPVDDAQEPVRKNVAAVSSLWFGVKLCCQAVVSVMSLIHAVVCFYCYIISADEYRPAYLCHSKRYMLYAKRLHRNCKHYFHVVIHTNRKMKAFVKPCGLSCPCPNHNVFPKSDSGYWKMNVFFSLKWSLSE